VAVGAKLEEEEEDEEALAVVVVVVAAVVVVLWWCTFCILVMGLGSGVMRAPGVERPQVQRRTMLYFIRLSVLSLYNSL
jgi:hypothetical protein